MAGVIHRRSWTIQQLVEVYDRQPEFNQNGIEAIWQLSFENLGPHSSAILGILSFCSADRIPQTLFERQATTNLPEGLEWCTDSEE